MAQVMTFLKIIQDGILPHQKSESVTTTNLIFRLHTKYASTTLLVASTLLFIQQFFADHLRCLRPPELGLAPESVPLNQFCYATGTYAVRNESYFGDTANSVTHFHHYFQWIPYILLIQGIQFHVPQLVWNKFVERGRLASFCGVAVNTHKNEVEAKISNGNSEESFSNSKQEHGTQTTLLNDGISFATTLGSSINRRYYYGFILCEILNLLMVILAFVISDWFLGSRFFSLVPQWISYLHQLRTGPTVKDLNLVAYVAKIEERNPLEASFPTLFICHWTKPNSNTTFTIECIMGLNITNQRVYIFFWFAYFLLCAIGLSNLVYRLVTTNSQKLRTSLIQRQTESLKRCVKNPGELQKVVIQIPAFDWFILKRILGNVNQEKFEMILAQVENTLTKGTTGSNESNGSIKGYNQVAASIELRSMST